MIALRAGFARAQTSNGSSIASKLGGKILTPMGSEVAGNADGTIPAWTGGMTTLPQGVQPNVYVPELFPDEKPVVVINASNLAQYANCLTDGVVAMMKKYGYSIKVYPTHRTQALPQYIYDNIAKNAVSAKFVDADPVGGRFGFEGAYGGVPFPIPDVSNPLTAGAQIIWNHTATWNGYAYNFDIEAWLVSGGNLALSGKGALKVMYPYYDPTGSVATFNDSMKREFLQYTAPPNLVGQDYIFHYSSDPYSRPDQAFELLNGEGRVRVAPELSFDTPSSPAGGNANWDEYQGFQGSLELYDWKYIAKQEMYIPYNDNGLFAASAEEAHQPHFINSELVRWELHRCWVVEATLHPGERNVLARRRFYVDEDTWTICLSDAWDAHGNLFHVGMDFNYCIPFLPGNILLGTVVYNMQSDNYVTLQSMWNQATKLGYTVQPGFPAVDFDPNHMAASAQY
jgi:hypothetical protein